MKNPTILKLLQDAGDTNMEYLPVLMRVIKFSSVLEVSEDQPASEVLELLRLNDPTILKKTTHDILKPSVPKSKAHECMTVIAYAMVVVMSLGYTASSIYTGITTMTPVSWESMVLPLSGPLMVLMHDRGLLSKENRGMLQAIVGQTPLSFMEAVSQRIATGNKSRHHEETLTEYDTDGRQINKKIVDDY